MLDSRTVLIASKMTERKKTPARERASPKTRVAPDDHDIQTTEELIGSKIALEVTEKHPAKVRPTKSRWRFWHTLLAAIVVNAAMWAHSYLERYAETSTIPHQSAFLINFT